MSENISSLSELEERFVSPCLCFMQIEPKMLHQVNEQLGMKGIVINIPIEINDIITEPPRKINEVSTCQIQLKRHILHKSYYMYETIRPNVILDALRDLSKSPLYIKHNITINPNTFNCYERNVYDTINFIVEHETENENVFIQSDSEDNIDDLAEEEANNEDCMIRKDNTVAEIMIGSPQFYEIKK